MLVFLMGYIWNVYLLTGVSNPYFFFWCFNSVFKMQTKFEDIVGGKNWKCSLEGFVFVLIPQGHGTVITMHCVICQSYYIMFSGQ